MSFLMLGEAARAARMRRIFAAEAPDIAFCTGEDDFDADAIEYVATWTPPVGMAQRYPNLRLLFSTGAGTDQFDLAELPPHIQLVRLVERAIIDGMVEYASGAVLALHRDFFAYARAQRDTRWQELPVRPAHERRVSILGAGELGRAVLKALRPFGFRLSAWSRSPRSLEGAVHYCGTEGLHAMLARTDILICLLPLTAETNGILCRDLFGRLPFGAALVNVGRGGHLVERDLLAALEEGRLSQAILDVTAPEPLPADHVFWSHPRILLTPHIASVTEAEGAARAMIANVRRVRQGLPPEGLVEREKGY